MWLYTIVIEYTIIIDKGYIVNNIDRPYKTEGIYLQFFWFWAQREDTYVKSCILIHTENLVILKMVMLARV